MGVKIKRGKLRKTQVLENNNVTLPEKKKKASERLFDYVMLIFGLKKIGKTSLCSELAEGDALFLMREAGDKALNIYSRYVRTWEEFRNYVKLLEKDKRFPMVVLDPVDKFYMLCVKYKCKKLGIEHLSEAEWGRGYQEASEEFMEWMDRLMATGKGIALLSHAAERTIKTRTGEEYDLITNTMSKQAREAIEGVVDIWAYYRYEDKRRVLTILGDDHIGAGHRIRKHFRYTDGKRIRNIDMGKDETQAAENLVKAFNNELENPKGGQKKGKSKVSLD